VLGGTFRVSLRGQNPGPAIATDSYFAVILPDSVTTLFTTNLSHSMGYGLAWMPMPKPCGRWSPMFNCHRGLMSRCRTSFSIPLPVERRLEHIVWLLP
jgi:hypothetical protein